MATVNNYCISVINMSYLITKKKCLEGSSVSKGSLLGKMFQPGSLVCGDASPWYVIMYYAVCKYLESDTISVLLVQYSSILYLKLNNDKRLKCRLSALERVYIHIGWFA